MRLTSSACGAVMKYVRLLWPGKSRLLVNQRLIRGKYLNVLQGIRWKLKRSLGNSGGVLMAQLGLARGYARLFQVVAIYLLVRTCSADSNQ